MKRYKNTLNRPLPVALRTTSISVSAKGVFEVESGQESNELKRLVDIGILRFLEETVKMTVVDKSEAATVIPEPVSPVVEVDNSGDVTLPMEVSPIKEVADTLTRTDVVVESEEVFEDKAAHKHRSKRR